MIDPKEKITTYNPEKLKWIITELQQRDYLADMIIKYAKLKQPIPMKLINEYNELVKVEVAE